MNISLKNSFLRWYASEYGVSLKNQKDDLSISSHLEEFKRFLSEEYNFDSSDSAVSLSEILELDFASDFSDDFISGDSMGMSELLFEFFEDEQMIALIDSNSDSTLDNDEIMEFIENVKHIDGDYSDVSLEDIVTGFEMLENQQVKMLEEQQANTNKSSGSKSSSKSINEKDVKDIIKMDNDALNNEIKTRNDIYNQNKINFNSLINGDDDKLSVLKQKMDSDYQIYKEQLSLVDEKLANQLDEAVNNVNSQQKIADDSDLKFTNQQMLVADLTAQHDTATLRLNSLLQTENELNSTDTSQMTPEELADIEDKKAKIQIQIIQARQEEEKLRAQKDEAVLNLPLIEADKNKNFELLDEYKNYSVELEQNISSQTPQLALYYNNYIDSKNEYYEYKTKQTDNARAELINSNEKVNEALSEQEKRKIKQEIKELSPSALSRYDEEWGKIISDAAKKYAQEGHSTSCGASVRKVLESLGYDYIARCKGKDWAVENMENSPDFEEVEFTLEEIKNGDVPIGSVACFSEYDGFGYGDGKSGHVAIVIDNNGKICEASGYIREAGINTNILELGHGTVRIFVPIRRPD